jgi:hypothetical protein
VWKLRPLQEHQGGGGGEKTAVPNRTLGENGRKGLRVMETQRSGISAHLSIQLCASCTASRFVLPVTVTVTPHRTPFLSEQ